MALGYSKILPQAANMKKIVSAKHLMYILYYSGIQTLWRINFKYKVILECELP